MRLRRDIDIEKFLEKAEKCEGDVRFCTERGDVLNLKSVLSQYVFAVAAREEGYIQTGRLEFGRESDVGLLREFME